VQARAVAGIAPQRMGRGEMGFHIDFEDARHVLSLSDGFGAPAYHIRGHAVYATDHEARFFSRIISMRASILV
jgi:hypothetical protein